LALAAPVVLAVAISCSSAASVFLDIPEQQDSEASGSGQSQPSTMTPSFQLAQDTAAPRPPIELVMQRDSALALLPRDGAGNVDWMAALSEGTIEPRSERPGQDAPASDGFDYDFVMQGANPMLDASFPHSAHTDWLACQSCHPGIFPYRNTEVTMAEINRGESCGQCHGKVAFPATACGRCHEKIPLSNSGKPARFLGDISFTRRADSTSTASATSNPYPTAQFPHWVHRIRYRCSACHPEPFEERSGSTEINMSGMQGGQWCGACHNGSDAFGLFQCASCHIPVEARSDSLP
jgi:c(7)-type cytochrome triheme protein